MTTLKTHSLATLTLLFLLLTATSNVHAQLSAKVQADLINVKLASAMKEDRHEDVLDLIGQLRDLGTETPLSLHYFEARSAAALDQWLRANQSLTLFLNNTTSKNTLYKPALSLYAEIEPKLGEARTKEMERARTDITPLLEMRQFSKARALVEERLQAGLITQDADLLNTISRAETAYIEEQRRAQAAQRQAEEDRRRRERDFEQRMANSQAYFRKELNADEKAEFEWGYEYEHQGWDYEYTHKASTHSIVSWPGSAGQCSVALSSAYIWYTESCDAAADAWGCKDAWERTYLNGNGQFVFGNHPSNVSGDFHSAYPISERIERLTRNPKPRHTIGYKFAYEPKYLDSGDIPDLAEINIKVKDRYSSSRSSWSFSTHGRGQIQHSSGSWDSHSVSKKTYEDIRGLFFTRERADRIAKALMYLNEVCTCRNFDKTYSYNGIADDSYNCERVAMRPLFEAKKTKPAPRPAPKPEPQPTSKPVTKSTSAAKESSDSKSDNGFFGFKLPEIPQMPKLPESFEEGKDSSHLLDELGGN